MFSLKSLKVPEISTFELRGVSHDMARSYLVTLPVTDRTLGVEVVLNKKGLQYFYFLEFHQTDLPLTRISSDIVYPRYDTSECYSLQSNKSSIFTFKTEPVFPWNEICEIVMEDDEEIRIQLLFIKQTNPKLLDRMWTQYEDYVNGSNIPSTTKLGRFLQRKLNELSAKIEGSPVARNVRIPEAEKKLREDWFRFEGRFYVCSHNEQRRKLFAAKVKSIFMNFNYINSWSFSRDIIRQSYFEHMQLRRMSLMGSSVYLSSSELSSFFVTGSEEAKDVVSTDTLEVVATVVEAQEDDEFRKNPFSIFTKGTKKQRSNDVHFATSLNKALRKLSLIGDEDVIIQKIQHGSTVQRITFTLPEGLKLSNLTKTSSDLQTELALSNVSFEQGEKAGTVALVIPQEDREPIFVGDIIDDDGFKKFIKDADLPLLFGVGTLGDIVFTCLTTIKHLLICGTTGSGKSVFLNSLLTVMFALVNPKMLQCIMIDPKMIELSPYEIYPHVQKVYTNMDEVEGVLAYLCETMDRRYQLFKDRGSYKNIQQYNRNESDKLPYIVVVIEELADLMSTNAENEDYIVRLAQKARAAGIHLIIATQYPIKEVVTSLIKRNIISRACFALDSGIAYKTALDETVPYALLGKGDGVYKMEGRAGIHRFQSPLIGKNEEEQDRIIKKLSTYWSKDGKKLEIDTSSAKKRKAEKELNEFKRYVLETGETRVGELRKLLSMRAEKITEMLNELIDINWIVKHKSKAKGYELILTEEQKIQFLKECSK